MSNKFNLKSKLLSLDKKQNLEYNYKYMLISQKLFVRTSIATASVCFSLIGFAFWITPSNFQAPKLDHSHIRMAYIFQGQAENFATPRYQLDYIKDVCGGGLSESPIHFHDNRDNLVHLHWQKVSGGQLLKFYGLNLIGGLDSYMGLKIDDILKAKFTPIPIHSVSLPKAKIENLFVYIKKDDQLIKKNTKDFLEQDLETFFGQNSQTRLDFEEVEKQKEEDRKRKQSFWQNNFQIEAKAHNGVEHRTQSEAEKHEAEQKLIEKEKLELEKKNTQAILEALEKTKTQDKETQKELKAVNNLLGDVVIFAQEKEPSPEQVKARFDTLVPLSDSVCGG